MATFAGRLIDAANNYNNSLPYDLPPLSIDVQMGDAGNFTLATADTMAPGQYNSNSFAAALLDNVGAQSDVVALQTYVAKQGYAAPGLEQPVPQKYFHK
ncbi:MAG TPA: hypothetical protein VGT78_10820 [Rhizomicrobium sp.]|nr:hypothetical protein [Rhizomicrobium sp.]